jgi:lysine-specific demethylase 3
MDLADAINVLLHANPRADGSPGCAVWDIFRPQDADGLREFLLEKYSSYKLVDPIHSQLFYLDSNDRKELYEKKGIYSHRIYQYSVSTAKAVSCG